MCYISSNIDTLFLSKSACQDLGIIDQNFPRIGSADSMIVNTASLPPLQPAANMQQQPPLVRPLYPMQHFVPLRFGSAVEDGLRTMPAQSFPCTGPFVGGS